jgi:hypothetical protein
MADKRQHEYLLAPQPIPKTRRTQCAVPNHTDPPFEQPNPNDLQSIDGGAITSKTPPIPGTHYLNVSLTVITLENLVIDGVIEAFAPRNREFANMLQGKYPHGQGSFGSWSFSR